MTRRLEDDCADFVVVGSGAGGATVTKTLSDAGAEVILVEEGPQLAAKQSSTSIVSTMQAAYRDNGMSALIGAPPIPYLQGRCVGGTTVVNGAIIWRLPEDVHAQWLLNDPGIGAPHSYANLEKCFEQIESDLHIGPTDARIAGQANELIEQGCNALGWQGRPINRNVKGCRGSGRCLHGCPTEAKQSMEVTYIPQALAKGARLYCKTKVEQIAVQHGRAKYVVARQEGKDRRIYLQARRGVVIACGALQTPALLAKSGLSRRPLGRNLMCHPGVSMAGYFEQPVNQWQGATQGYEITEYRRQGIKLETLAIAPELGAYRLTGVGEQLKNQINRLPNLLTVAAALKSEARGHSRAFGGSVWARYQITNADADKAKSALKIMAELFRSCGATTVLPSVDGWPNELKAKTAPQWIEKQKLKPKQLKLAVTHLLGGASMGSNPKQTVVSPALQLHGCQNLYVADASIFPTNTGVNPQHTIMALAMNAARRWA